MKLVETAEATGTLAEYTANVQSEPVLVTEQGRPIAALVPIENADLETITLSMNPRFLDVIERSRARVRDEGGVSSDEMRQRFQPKMPFVTYENRRNPHITIHNAGCSQIGKNGGKHKYGQGEYHEHATYHSASEYAQKSGLPVIICSFCKPAAHC